MQYNDDLHRDDFYQLNLEYLSGLDQILTEKFKIRINPEGTVQEYLNSVFTKFTELEPPVGIIYILEIDGTPMGMGGLRRLEDPIGEIKRMYIRPEFQGYGFGKKMYELLEDKAVEFGLDILKLDTAAFAEAAVHIYKKYGFKEVGEYSGGEWEARDDADNIIMYMEKRL